jgi:hypothetical protein
MQNAWKSLVPNAFAEPRTGIHQRRRLASVNRKVSPIHLVVKGASATWKKR